MRRAVDKQRAVLDLPPVTDDLAAVLAAAAFPEAAQAALPPRAVCGSWSYSLPKSTRSRHNEP